MYCKTNSDNDDSQRLGAVVAFNAWLPLRHKFCGLCKDFWYPNKECNLRTSKERTGPINILQVRLKTYQHCNIYLFMIYIS